MERLTDKFKCKNNTGKIVNAHNVSKQQVIDKLSEYEDTGVTPQKVEELIKEKAELKARFEKAVGLPCLPCKVGDKVRALKGCFYLPYAQRILSTQMIDCEIVVIKKNKKGMFILVKPLIKEVWGARSAYKWFPISAINRTVFPAEQALKECEER